VGTIKEILVSIKDFLDIPLFRLGDTHVTLWAILYLVILLVLLFYLTGRLKYFIVTRVLAKSSIEIGVRQAVGSIIRYGVVAVGVVVIFETAGIDLSALTILAGALGIGVGFGLQNITNNLVSGLIILLERPIKVGDRIEVGKVVGDVLKISLRATTVRTNDNIAIIIPNSDFVSSSVTNWSYTDRDVRFNIPVGVSYNSDPEAVKKILLAVADEHSGVLKVPEPDVIFEEFGESSLNFLLRVWTREYITRPYILRSELNFAIKKKFKEQGIEIPFPQRDLHIRSGAIQLKPSS
jgi:small-conductance mechanosensitive channel